MCHLLRAKEFSGSGGSRPWAGVTAMLLPRPQRVRAWCFEEITSVGWLGGGVEAGKDEYEVRTQKAMKLILSYE